MSANPAKQNRGYLLASFAPSSGVGFYRSDEELHKFDLVAAEDSVLDPDAQQLQLMEAGQVPFDASFDRIEDLKAFSETEYLRDKKNTYYALLFTQQVGEQIRVKTLELLNAPEFFNVTVSAGLIPVLRETAKRGLVRATVARASDLKLKNVEVCLQSELNAVVDPLIEPTPAEAALSSVRSMAEQTLNLPVKAVDILWRFLAAIGDAVGDLTLSKLEARDFRKGAAEPLIAFRMPEQSVRGLDPRFAEVARQFRLAFQENSLDLFGRLSETAFMMREWVPAPAEEDLLVAGRRIMEFIPQWDIRPYWSGDPPRPSRFGYSYCFTPAEGRPGRVERVLEERYLKSLLALRGRSVIARSANGTLFLSQFAFTKRILTARRYEPEYVENLAFWTGCYAQPQRMSGAVPDFGYGPFMYQLRELLSEWRGAYRFYSQAKYGEEPYPIYHAMNVPTFLLLTSRESFSLAEAVDLLLSPSVRASREFLRKGLPDPRVILLNNILVYLLQGGRLFRESQAKFLVREITRGLRRAGVEPEELTPFVRVVL
jgi:hypothetical protein